MIQRRSHTAPLGMGSFVPQFHVGAPATPGARHCPRCGARISRYASITDQYCAPCATIIHPWTPPREQNDRERRRRRAQQWEAHKANRCECGAYKTSGAQSCVNCYLKRIGAHHPTWYGPICACGGPKRPEARMCRHCRYPLSFPSEPAKPTL